jgi:hypothetical protein
MTPSMTELEAVIERVGKLERQNRRMKRAGAVALILATAVFLMGQGASKKTVEANEFILKDASGKVRGRFGMDLSLNGGPQLSLLDSNGDKRALLDVGDSAGLTLNHRSGKNVESVVLVAGNDGLSLYFGKNLRAAAKLTMDQFGPDLAFFDANAKKRLNLQVVNADSSPGIPSESGIALYDTAGKLRAGLDVRADAQGSGLFFVDSAGKAGASLDEKSLKLSDNEGFQTTIGTMDLVTPRTGETHKTSAASVVMFGKDKTLLWKAP